METKRTKNKYFKSATWAEDFDDLFFCVMRPACTAYYYIGKNHPLNREKIQFHYY